jgi:hypothetical protein
MHRLHLAKNGGAVGLDFQVSTSHAVHEKLIPAQGSPTEPLVDHQLGHSIVDRTSFLSLARHVDLDFAAYPQLADGRSGVPIPLRVTVEIDENPPDLAGRSIDSDYCFMTPHERFLVSVRLGASYPLATRSLASDIAKS